MKIVKLTLIAALLACAPAMAYQHLMGDAMYHRGGKIYPDYAFPKFTHLRSNHHEFYLQEHYQKCYFPKRCDEDAVPPRHHHHMGYYRVWTGEGLPIEILVP